MDDETLIAENPAISYLGAHVLPNRTCYFARSTTSEDLLATAATMWRALSAPRLTPQPGAGHSGVPVTEVVAQEMRWRSFRPEDQIRKIVRSLALPAAYQWDAGGDPAQVSTCTWRDLRRYHRQFYRLGNMLVFCSGERDLTAQLISRLETSWAPAPTNPFCGEGSQLSGNDAAAIPAYLRRYRDDGVTRYILAWPLPAVSSAQHWARCELATEIASSALAKWCEPQARRIAQFAAGIDALAQPVVSLGLASRETTPGRLAGLLARALGSIFDDAGGSDVRLAARRIEQRLSGGSLASPYDMHVFRRTAGVWANGLDPAAFTDSSAALRHAARELAGDPHRLRAFLYDTLRPETAAVAVEGAAGYWRHVPAPDVPAAAARGKRPRPDGLPAASALRALPAAILGPAARSRRNGARQVCTADGHRVAVTTRPGTGRIRLTLGFDLAAMPPKSLACVPVMAAAWTDEGCSGLGGQSFASRMRQAGRGLVSHYIIGRRAGGSGILDSWLLFQQTVPIGEFRAALRDITDLVQAFNSTDIRLLRHALWQAMHDRRKSLTEFGHRLADTRLRALAGDPSWRARDILEGIGGLIQLRQIMTGDPSLACGTAREFSQVLQGMLGGRMMLHATCDARVADAVRDALLEAGAQLPEAPQPTPFRWPDDAHRSVAENFMTDTGGSVYGKSIDMAGFDGAELIGKILTRYLKLTMLARPEIARSSTYAAFAGYDDSSRQLGLVGLLVPRPAELERTFQKVGNVLRSADVRSERFRWSARAMIQDQANAPVPGAGTPARDVMSALGMQRPGSQADLLERTSQLTNNDLAAAADYVEDAGTRVNYVAISGLPSPFGPHTGNGRTEVRWTI
jgi:hypothetical protein